MNSFDIFFKAILKESGISLSRELTANEIRCIISQINQYFYTSYEGIGKTYILDEDFDYFSDFHKFWERYHKEILNPNIDDSQCGKVSDILHDVYIRNGKKAFYELYDTFSLKPEEICLIRFFSANQDFRGTRDFKQLFNIFKDDQSIFDIVSIHNYPEDFLKNIGITSLSQNDKRIKFAKTASELLIEKKIKPYELFSYFNRDVSEIRSFLTSSRGSGFGHKKTDMFIRDMIILGVWENPINFDKIDVASDINTVKVALRSKILKTAIPLISSFMDIFCYQYSLIDEMNSLAWRRVWEIWSAKYTNECIESPCLIDYFVYRIIGKEFCKETLCIFQCKSVGHTFKWHSSRNRTCQICFRRGLRNSAFVISKIMPCTDNEGNIVIEKNEYVDGKDAVLHGIKECPFSSVCSPKDADFKKLNPPKSISILGQTGWESARTIKDEGGGGLMS